MPLNSQSPAFLHFLQNILLIILSAFLVPLCTAIVLLSKIISPFTENTKHIKHHRKWRASSSASFRPCTVLVTGVGMSKGLAIARAFYREGHRVIGADFEPYGVPVCGRFSVALEKFYKVSKPVSGNDGTKKYVNGLVDIIQREKVELWVSCSGVASAVQDGEAKEGVEKLTSCKAIQFDVALTETFHQKHSFIEHTRNLGLNVPETHLITSVDTAIRLLFSQCKEVQKRYIMKCVLLDDSIRANMILLPLQTISETKSYLVSLQPSPSRPFVLQQYIFGPEYCTHSLIIEGKILAFTACRSSEFLMHYQALPPSAVITQTMLKYTSQYAQKTGSSMTGHFSIDFLLDEDADQMEDPMKRIYPIECNPRAHTAVVLFAGQGEEMVKAYLSILPDRSPGVLERRPRDEADIIMGYTPFSYYWVGHDLVTKIIIPFWSFTTRQIDMWGFLASWVEFLDHLLFWRDGTYEVWDPLPFWCLYCVYWPGQFFLAILLRRWWSRSNVSTTKMFSC